MSDFLSNKYDTTNVKNSVSVLLWSVAWAGSMLLAIVGFKFFWSESKWLIGLSIGLHLVFALFALRAHFVWLENIDELMRGIQLKSAAFTLGIVWMVVIVMLLLNSIGWLPVHDGHLVLLTLIMAIVMPLSTFFGMRKVA